jgi:hypothetical protein
MLFGAQKKQRKKKSAKYCLQPQQLSKTFKKRRRKKVIKVI